MGLLLCPGPLASIHDHAAVRCAEEGGPPAGRARGTSEAGSSSLRVWALRARQQWTQQQYCRETQQNLKFASRASTPHASV